MPKVKFDCNGPNAPAYGCDKPGDNSGYYYPADKVEALIDSIRLAQKFMSAGLDDEAAETIDAAMERMSV